jgi:hypothetical protein
MKVAQAILERISGLLFHLNEITQKCQTKTEGLEKRGSFWGINYISGGKQCMI